MILSFKLFTIFTLMFIGNLYADRMNEGELIKPSEFLDFIYEKSELVSSGESTKIIISPTPTSADEFILIRTGIKDWGIDSLILFSQYSSYADDYKTCKAENLPFANFAIQDNQITFNQKFKALRECLSIKIEDQDKKGIQIPDEVEQNCRYQKINENEVIASAGDCFIKPKLGQTFTLTLSPNPKCYDRKFLEEKNISPMEILATIKTYIYPTPYIGQFFTETEKLDEKAVILNINPGSELFNLLPIEIDPSTNKTIYRPSSLLFPQMTISALEMQYFSKALFVNLGLLLSTNNTKTICHSNLCSNQSYFDIPLVAEVFLYKLLPNGKKEELGSKLFGDRIPNRWNGNFFSVINFKNVEINEGDNLSLEFSFYDPYFTYQQLKKSIKSMFGLGLGRGTIGSIGSLGGIGTLGGMGGIGGLPSFGSGGVGPGGLAGAFPRMSLSLKLPRLSQSINDPTFPPEYKEICNQDLSVCEKASSKEYARMIAQFKVKSIKDNMVDWDKKLSISWKTNLWNTKNYELDLINNIPRINCEN